ncbi:predicted protein [Naegleria gruberi]|uniref:Predicted protein n=1 Tax=Naegleria gruberi TaxID=5762 RepID=D2UZD2_NAEGR|nr:uncharacterized protein NAEGRDRAFT_29629 [Naegleria gruberi]EFC50127.1 predicted protein [Naegleria gruberi]|eukprot:XP_002682871.1 predicted protein [Naegleria gruberi strain NEG-M]
MAGGAHNQPITEESRTLAQSIKAKVEEITARTFDIFEVIAHSTQVVAGINHKLKIKVGDSEHVHVKVFESLQGQQTVQSVEQGKTATCSF